MFLIVKGRFFFFLSVPCELCGNWPFLSTRVIYVWCVCVWCVYMLWPEGLISSTQSLVLRGRRVRDKASRDSYLRAPNVSTSRFLNDSNCSASHSKMFGISSSPTMLIHQKSSISQRCVKAKLKRSDIFESSSCLPHALVVSWSHSLGRSKRSYKMVKNNLWHLTQEITRRQSISVNLLIS